MRNEWHLGPKVARIAAKKLEEWGGLPEWPAMPSDHELHCVELAIRELERLANEN